MSIELGVDSSQEKGEEEASLVEERLDEHACRMIECYAALLAERDKLNARLDAAHLNMSKARSLLGCTRLSVLQVPGEELEPRVTVNTSDRFELNVLDASFPNWFGLLVPMSLRDSHKAFAASLHHVVAIGALQTRLAQLQSAYATLLAQKKAAASK